MIYKGRRVDADDRFPAVQELMKLLPKLYPAIPADPVAKPESVAVRTVAPFNFAVRSLPVISSRRTSPDVVAVAVVPRFDVNAPLVSFWRRMSVPSAIKI